MPHEFHTTSKDRKLNRSRIYRAHERVPLLYSAVLCALKGVNQISPPKILALVTNARVSVTAILMTEKSYLWGKLTTTIGHPINSRSGESGTLARPKEKTLGRL
jgi:hypothetical protein